MDKKITVKTTKKFGRGVYAKTRIRRGAIIERSPLVILPKNEVDETELVDYCFDWARNKVALALGTGSLFNHSFDPNAEWEEDKKKMQMVFQATQTIQQGEQIFINYGYPLSEVNRPWYREAAIIDIKSKNSKRVNGTSVQLRM
jgi:SET domain-containing protein